MLPEFYKTGIVPAFFALILGFMSCKGDKPLSVTEDIQQLLESYKEIGQYSAKDISNRIPYSIANKTPQFTIKVYKVIYKTKYPGGKEVKASGAVIIPVADKELGLVSLQHGTILNDASAPSYYQTSNETYLIGSYLASIGYIVSAPDYLGYGASKEYEHPYEHAASLASSSADLLIAVKELCAKEKVRLNNKLFLTGYSEGGYATMSLHKYIQENLSDRLKVTASVPAAGAYNKTEFAKYVLGSKSNLNFINTYLWVLKTYNTLYNINRPFSYYLNEPYASKVNKEGVHYSQVSTNPQQLFTKEFKEEVLSQKDSPFNKALAENNVYDWKPVSPVLLVHGTQDDYVPFFNAKTAFEAMKKNGAEKVELRAVEGTDHFSLIPSYYEAVISFFSRF